MSFYSHYIFPRCMDMVLSGVNRIVADGCHLNHSPSLTISSSGLRIESLDNFYLKKAPEFGAYIYRGVAVK